MSCGPCASRHKRGRLTQEQIETLLGMALLRPLAKAGRERAPEEGKNRRQWKRVPLGPENIEAAVNRTREALRLKPARIAERERLGRERFLIYATMLQTGLRLRELQRLTWGMLDLEGRPPLIPPAVTVAASIAKNSKTQTLPLREDLVAEPKAWRSECGEPGLRERVFEVPRALVKILQRDLAAAGIPYHDEDLGVYHDVHAFRTTMCTQMNLNGTPLRVAMAMMRHSSAALTTKIYHADGIRDCLPALDALPEIPARKPPTAEQEAAELAPTGTDDKKVAFLAGNLA